MPSSGIFRRFCEVRAFHGVKLQASLGVESVIWDFLFLASDCHVFVSHFKPWAKAGYKSNKYMCAVPLGPISLVDSQRKEKLYSF